MGGSHPLKVEGLTFADDPFILRATRRLLALVRHHMITWTMEHEVTDGIRKCETMVIGKNMQILRKEPERYPISGDPRPIADAYTCLRLTLRADTNVSLSMGDRYEKAREMVARLSTSLKYSTIPMSIKAASGDEGGLDTPPTSTSK